MLFLSSFLDPDVPPVTDEPVVFILPADEEDANEHLVHNFELADITKSYLKREFRLSRGRYKKKIELAKFMFKFFGDSLTKNSFRCWQCDKLRIKYENLVELLSWRNRKREEADNRFRKTSTELVKKVQDFWKKHCVISIHRSNDRNKISIAPRKLHPSIQKVTRNDENVTLTEKMKFTAHRYLYIKPIRKLHEDFVKENRNISYGHFYEFKPFYILKPSERERESCMCSTCLNIHVMYDVLRKNMPNHFPKSTTEYLTSDFKCIKRDNYNFHCLSCINGKCPNVSFPQDTPQKYYQFEMVTTEYYDKHGKKKAYKRTARVDRGDTLHNLYILLQSMATKYLVHRFFVSVDDVFWSNFLSEYRDHIITLDYSQNINLTPKFVAQSHHFSGRQQTLHCSIKQKEGVIEYLYHLSDDTNHDSVLTLTIIHNIIDEHPEIISSGTLVLCSDNCTSQYKSQYIFEGLKRMAMKYDINIVWFYGIPGHGRGLVDAMSSFGCKSILRDAVIYEDMWFNSAEEMVSFLREVTNDTKKHYELIDDRVTAKQRSKKKAGHPIKYTQSFHMVAVDPHGNFTTKTILDVDDDLVSMNFLTEGINEVVLFENMLTEEELSEEDELERPEDIVLPPMVYEVIEAESFVGLRSPPKSLELFFVVKVIDKNVATEFIKDQFGHEIAPREPYLTVVYLDYKYQTKQHVQFGMPKNATYIYTLRKFLQPISK